jgi:hypothetical protein
MAEEVNNRLLMSELYIAYFNRAPDAAGLEYWLTDIENETMTFGDIAANWANEQAEFVQMYGSEIVYDTFITQVYQNVLGRDPDTAGAAYWKSDLEDGVIPTEQFILAILNGAKADTGSTTDAAVLSNRSEVGLYLADSGISDTTFATSAIKPIRSDTNTKEIVNTLIDMVKNNSTAMTKANTTLANISDLIDDNDDSSTVISTIKSLIDAVDTKYEIGNISNLPSSLEALSSAIEAAKNDIDYISDASTLAGSIASDPDSVIEEAADVQTPDADDRSLSYSSSVFTESSKDDGSTESSITITLTNGTFSGTTGDELDGVTVINLPAGLTASVVKSSDTTATFTLSGNALSHTDDYDISNLTIVFGDDAFSTGSAATITGFKNSSISIDFSSSDDSGNDRYNVTTDADPNDKLSLTVASGDLNVSTNISSTVVSLDDFFDDAQFDGITGSGFSVAVLDTGIDLDHPFFGADSNGDGISDRILYSQDFTDDGDGTANDVQGHGTNVSSIIASSNSTYTGMAPDAGIVALQVLGNDGSGSFAWIEKALQWIIQNADTYNIAAINMSLGAYGNNNSYVSTALSDEFAALESMGIINIAAAGNDYYDFQSEGASYPATDASVVSVGATFDADIGDVRWGAMSADSGVDRIVPFSQRSDTVVDIFAPGAMITGAGVGGGLSTMAGTSQATPHIAGIALLAQQLAAETLGRTLTQDEFVTLLQDTGLSIVDGDDEVDNVVNTNDTYQRADIEALAIAIMAMSGDSDDNSTDIEQSVDTKAILSIDTEASSTIDFGGDKDWYKLTLEAGVTYQFELDSDDSKGNGLDDPWLVLRDNNGLFIIENGNEDDSTNDSAITFTADRDGTYFLSAEAYSSSMTGDYIIKAKEITTTISDDYSANTSTTGELVEGMSVSGDIESIGDKDWFKFVVESGNTYTIDMVGATLEDTYIGGLYTSNGVYISGTTDDDSGAGTNSKLIYEATSNTTLFLEAQAYGNNIGTYNIYLDVEEIVDDYAADRSTLGRVVLTDSEGSLDGSIEREGDVDWIKVSMQDGAKYNITLSPNSDSTLRLSDSVITGIYNSSGTLISGTYTDVYGANSAESLEFEATADGLYYLGIKGYGTNIGDYTLSVEEEIITDDYSANSDTTATISLSNHSGSLSGDIEVSNDEDWFKVVLTEGYEYEITMSATTLNDPYLAGIYDSNSNLIPYTTSYADDSGDATVVFRPAQSGTYFVSARDYGSANGTYTISVEGSVIDDYSADRYTAGEVYVDSSATGSIEVATDIDWFATRLSAGDTYTISLDGFSGRDIKGVYNQNGSLVSGSLATGATDTEIEFTATYDGVYYVSAGSDNATGDYTLSVDKNTPADDYSSNTSTTGSLTLVNTMASSTGTIETANDTDWFAISLENGTTYEINLLGDSLRDTYLRGVYDASGNMIAGTTDDDGGNGTNSRLSFTADSTSTYYISAGAYGQNIGTYSITVDELGSLDDYASTVNTTGTLSTGANSTGEIESANDTDWFAMTLSANTTYSIDLMGGTLADTYLRGVYDADGNMLSNTTDDDSGSGRDSKVVFTTDSAGTYYVSAGAYGSYTGTYTLDLNEAADADDYLSNGYTTGVVSTTSSASGEIEMAGDTDWFAISMSANTTYTIDLVGDSLRDTYLRGIYNSSGSIISGTTNDDGGEGYNSQVIYTPTSSGTYYISAGAYSNGTGTYILSVDSTTSVVSDDYLSDISTTGSVSVGGSISANIESAHDTDWFEVALSANTTYSISLEGYTLRDTYLRGIYDSDGESIAGTYNDDGGVGYNSLLYFTPDSSGVYYISAGAYNTYTGSYNLSVEIA